MKIFGIEFAPLRIPLERRLQTVAVYQFTLSFLFLGFFCVFLSFYLLFTRFYYISLIYAVWYYYDRPRSSRGGRRVQWVRSWSIWKYYANFFPLKLTKTVELNPNKNYIFASHPHGVMCYSHFCNFATEGTGFSEIFPGLRPYLLTLAGQYTFPFFRDYFMLTGSCSATKESMEYILSKVGKGNVLGLVVGGAIEALNASPGNFKLNLKSRKGFIKIAMKHGADVCPVYSFGENDLYSQVPNPEGSFVRKLQLVLTRICGFSPPIFFGRGVFNYTFGLLPHRRPMNTVVGKPIEVTRNENPTNEEVADLHQKYIDALKDLFETHKTKYGIGEDEHLIIE
ncbi:2-acylglycerol O-acyltransferase 2-like isoform X2 [Haliotis rubra]|nr:2-acylglycerol O-acyltransferase 2-like isoform X2 [Haliotis rubra]XP_046557533.1 2-acylglycerol O-acyltransferase 2-like isoform X2 [Haliotis rubra]XP_046557534.1 2-acylglycerol O-acyltransferase 2-like isoform X2 [Haliotis rubra]XP_046557535.1 2-acylglycerol O-acyltransferase 2-like isoform X2 [Haliotis rubra]